MGIAQHDRVERARRRVHRRAARGGHRPRHRHRRRDVPAQGRRRPARARGEPTRRRRTRVDVLAKVGGFEIAGLAGVVLGAAAARVPVVVDGFIASVAALAAVRLAPHAAGYLIASHRSVEAGHRLVLQALGKSRCWISTCASAKAPAPRSRCSWSTPRSRSPPRWRRSNRPASATRPRARSAFAREARPRRRSRSSSRTSPRPRAW